MLMPAPSPQLVAFYGVIFFVPPLLMIAWNGGKLSMTREEFLQTETARRRVRTGRTSGRAAGCPSAVRHAQRENLRPEAGVVLRRTQVPRGEEREMERKDAMNRVMFETKADMRTDWAIKREEQRAQQQQQGGSSGRV